METITRVVEIHNPHYQAAGPQKGGKPDGDTITPIPASRSYGSQTYAPWGDDNNQPKYILDKIAPSIASSGNLLNVHKILARGIVVVKVEGYESATEEKLTIVRDKVITDFFKKNSINKFLLDTCRDLVTLGNAYPEFILSKDRQRINRISRNKAFQCRVTKKNPSTHKIEYCGVSAEWPNEIEEKIIKIPMLDEQDPLTDLLNTSSGHKFSMALHYSTDDKEYYHDPFWYSAILSKWVDNGNEVPLMKNSIFKNQISIKFHIEIPITHFKHKYKDWDSLKQADRVAKIDAELKLVLDVLKGSAQAGKAFISLIDFNPITRTQDPGWKITVIDDKWKEGAHLPDSAAANSEILFRQLIDPSIFGAGMVGGPYSGSAGSGSDKREADIIKTSILKPFRDELIRPLELWRDYNELPPEWEFRFLDTILTTLDQGSGSKKILS